MVLYRNPDLTVIMANYVCVENMCTYCSVNIVIRFKILK